MIAQRDALLRLLADDDAATLGILKGQLVARGHAALGELRELLAVAEPQAARHLREVIAEIEMADADALFAELCRNFGPEGNLEEAAWGLAATFLPGEDFAPQRAVLDGWGAEVKRRLRKAATPLDRIETLVEFLGEEVGLRGNEEDYYNINNSLLPEVIDTRMGIPITLSLIYMLVGQRAGVEVTGVGMPGHVVVRHGHDFFDPFLGGKRLGLDECRERLAKMKMPLTAEHLRPVTAPQFLLRMLGNIHAISVESDPPLAAKVEGWIVLCHAAKAA